MAEPIQEFSMIVPDDFHHHLRDGDVLPSVAFHASRSFARVLAMPNIKPPVRTVAEAEHYRNRIMAAAPPDSAMELLMTLYLTDNTSPEEIRLAQSSGIVKAVKLYPAGATTNSELGVTSMDAITPALQVSTMSPLSRSIHFYWPVYAFFKVAYCCVMLRNQAASFSLFITQHLYDNHPIGDVRLRPSSPCAR